MAAHETQDLQPFRGIAPRQPEIGDDDVVGVGDEKRFRFLQLAGAADIETRGRKVLLQRRLRRRLVFDDEETMGAFFVRHLLHAALPTQRQYRSERRLAIPANELTLLALSVES